MKEQIIGRKGEIAILNRLLKSNQAELLAIYGRRRIGKTYLIQKYYADQLVFICSGESGGPLKVQLANFLEQLNIWFPDKKITLPPPTWQEAFVLLRQRLEEFKSKDKKVLFFDELPWLDTHKSGFVSAFGYFWNTYLSNRSDILVVICGSAASWMIKKIINNKGGLHNRITQKIRLTAFTLKETKAYLRYRNIPFTDYQILQLYMVTGGVPHYLNAIRRGVSVHQAIDEMCFSENGVLVDEFQNLYAALFQNHDKHIKVIQALAKKQKGLTRTEIIDATKLTSGGTLSVVLEELMQSGFIAKTEPYNKIKTDGLYRLIDEFSFFYLKFMKDHLKMDDWQTISKTSKYLGWCGYSFENICMKHLAQIKNALGISGVNAVAGAWYKAGSIDYDGAQIDLLLDRRDNVVNIFEIKFSMQPFTIDKRYFQELQRKMATFREAVKKEKAVCLTFLTTYGVVDNAYKKDLVDNELTMEALFE